MRRNDPVLHTVALSELRPTQLTIGAHEVAQRRAAWEQARGKARAALLAGHMVPGVIGPKGRFYIIDHHHLARALMEAGAHGVFVNALADLSRLSRDDFWITMDHHGWVHTYDARGRRTTFDAIPKRLVDLADDPYRSVAGAVRRAGGFAKETTPFAEFLWAQYFRSRLDARQLRRDFDATITKALQLACAKDADHLPGWCGQRAQAKESAAPSGRASGRRR